MNNVEYSEIILPEEIDLSPPTFDPMDNLFNFDEEEYRAELEAENQREKELGLHFWRKAIAFLISRSH